MTMNMLALCSTLVAFGLCTVYATRPRELARVKVIARSRRLPPRA
jgi:hypothetical protein